MAQISAGLLAQHDEENQTPLWKAFERFSSTLDAGEKAAFTDVTLKEVLVNVRALDRLHSASSKSRNLTRRLDPFLNFLDRHARALDAMVQVQPNPSALIWGIVRVVIESAVSFSQYFRKLVAMVERLSDSFSLYQEYERQLSNNQRFQEALAAVYFDVLMFLKKARVVFMTKGFAILCRNIWRTFEFDFQDTLEAIARHASSLEGEISLAHRLDMLKKLDRQSEEQRSTRESLSRIEDSLHLRRKVMKWLSPIDMEEIRCRESRRRTQSCGQWLLSHEIFQAWLQSQHRGIWVSGSTGSGKTVLSTFIIDTIRDYIENDAKQAFAFFFCDKRGENSLSALKIFSCIIAQVLAQLDSIPDRIYASYKIAARYGRSKISASDQPIVILKDLASSLNKLYILVDGVDELTDAPAIIEPFTELVKSTAGIQVIVLSRDISTLSSGLNGFPKIKLTSTVVSSDIDNYLSRELAELSIGDAELQHQIFERLSQSADGMFLWANLMIQTLKSATSRHEVMEVLSDLPIGLDTTYSAVLNKLATEPPRRRVLAKKVLQWICCSARPLHWKELESALAFEQSRAELVESKKPFKSAVLELCSSLIEYLSGSDQFRPTHFSVREFLLSAPDDHSVSKEAREFFIREELGHHELAEVCLAYLIQHVAHENFIVDTTALPLLEYSTLFWCHHVCNAYYCPELESQVMELLTSGLRRQIWMLRFLFWQSSTFPLQYLMKLQKLLRDWISRGPNHPLHKITIDWTQDIPSILLCDGSPTSVGEQDQNLHNDLYHLNKLMPRISYFEKLMVIRDLSREYTMTSTLTCGEQWLTAALNCKCALHGPSHISTVWLMNSLGIIYDQQERVALSAETQESALAIQTSVLGPDHLETIWTVNELGRIYRHLNNFDKAESMHQRALTVLRNALHPQDPQIAWTLNTLARTYRRQGRFNEAIALHDQALAIQRAVLGELHPHTLWATMDMAGCYHGQGRFRESADLYKKALEGREKVLGLRHADTLWAMNNLGLVFAELGQIDAARSLQERAIHGQTEVLGPQHRHTLWTREVLDGLSEGASGSGVQADTYIRNTTISPDERHPT